MSFLSNIADKLDSTANYLSSEFKERVDARQEFQDDKKASRLAYLEEKRRQRLENKDDRQYQNRLREQAKTESKYGLPSSNGATHPYQSTYTATETPAKNNKTMLYAVLGVVVVAIIILLIRRKK